MEVIIQQILKFGVTGILNTIIDFGVFNFLVTVTGIHSGWMLGLINMLAVFLAATNSYFLNRSWTFKAASDQQQRQQLLRFIIATAIGMLINSIAVTAVAAVTAWVPISYYLILNAGKIVGAIFSSSWNFIAYRHWVFINNKEEKPPKTNPPVMIPGMLSVIIPAYNEEKRLEKRIRSLAAELNEYHLPVELIIVDDGSRDNTPQLIRQLADEFPIITGLQHAHNRGKGAAVQTGVFAARGEYIIFVDADNTFSCQHILQILNSLQNGSTIAIGQRKSNGGSRVAGEPMIRHFMGKSFNLMVQALLLPGISDTQCGLKGFRRNAAEEIFKRLRLQRFAFDVELLVLARALDYNITPVRVEAEDCSGSTVNPLFSSLQMALDLIKVRLGLVFNLYHLRDGHQMGIETGIAASLFTLALALRIPWLWQVPRYIDELKEVNLAFNIYLGKALPLHNVAHDIGSMHNFILAWLFKLFGPSIFLPRLYVAVTSAITVVLLYRLGEKMFNRQVGLLAAGLLLTNGMHIMVTHMAWANCTTPFFFVLALLATINARDYKSGGWLVISALLWAATLQTHSSVIIYIIVVTAYVLSPGFRKQCAIKTGWYWGAAFAFLTGYANMIYYNIVSVGGSFKWLGHKTYAVEAKPGISNYLHNLGSMITEILRSASSTYAQNDYWFSYFNHPLYTFAAVLLIGGIILAIRKRENLPVLMLTGGLVIMPWINTRYNFFLATRYVMPEIICTLLLIALAAVTIVQRLQEKVSYSNQSNLLKEAVAALCILLIMLQPVPFYNYCRQMSMTNNSNKAALSVISIVHSAPPQKSIVLLDHNLPLLNQPLPLLLNMSQHPYITLHPSPLPGKPPASCNWETAIRSHHGREIIAVMNQKSYNHLRKQLPILKAYAFTWKIVIPHPEPTVETIYVVKINSRNKVIANAGITSPTRPIAQNMK